MVIQEIDFGSDAYRLSMQLREAVLRVPLGLCLSEEDTAGEEQQVHIAAFNSPSHIVGTIILKPVSAHTAEIRGVAVSPALQNAGLGRQLVDFAEATAFDKGFNMLEMKARISAQGFYEKLGYIATGSEFIKSTIPHIRMEKLIAFEG